MPDFGSVLGDVFRHLGVRVENARPNPRFEQVESAAVIGSIFERESARQRNDDDLKYPVDFIRRLLRDRADKHLQ